MKIFCVGRNYGAHAAELGNDLPEDPVIFCKPDTALLKDGQPFFLPDFSSDVHHEIEIVLRIGKPGKKIAEKFALSYISDISVGIDFTARDLQAKLKSKGLPWELAKGFDGSAVLGALQPAQGRNISGLHFQLQKNGVKVQEGQTGDMIFHAEKIISFISNYFTLKVGDLIYTGTPAGVGPVVAGDLLEGFLEDEKLLRCEVK
jgi:2-keto-4-pentenoate hydratase/2-oxohepta-3-ene-1,7-dioic acid hydratase in catechol pathway